MIVRYTLGAALASALLFTGCSDATERGEMDDMVGEEISRTEKPTVRRVDSTSDAEPVISPVVADAASDLPLYRAEADEEISLDSYRGNDDWLIGCSLGCAVSWDLRASSRLEDDGAIGYGVAMLDDGRLETAWVEGVEGHGVGERVTFEFPRAYFEENFDDTVSIPFHGLMIVNGYAKNRTTFRKNGRVKRARLYDGDRPVLEIELLDFYGVQEVSFPSFMISADSEVSFEILEVYPGSEYDDVAITELLPHGAH